MLRHHPLPYIIVATMLIVMVPKGVGGDGVDLRKFNLPNHGFLYASSGQQLAGVILEEYMSSSNVTKVLKVACRIAGFRGKPSLMYKGSYKDDSNSFPMFAAFIKIKSCKGNEVSLYKCNKVITYLMKTLPIKIGCGYPSVLVTFSNTTNQSSVAAGSSPMFALNENLTSCFVSKMEKDPWIEVRLTNTLFIHTLTVVLGNSSRQPVVMTSNKSRVITCTVTMVTGREQIVKCKTDFKTNTINIALEGENLSLTLCRLDVFGIESKEQAHGALFNGWKTGKTPSSDGSILKFDPLFKTTPDAVDFIPTFDVKNRKLTASIFNMTQYAYLLVKQSGTYSIGVACGHLCEVWFKRAEEPGLGDQGTSDELIIKYESSSSEDKYELSSKQNTNIRLSACHLYNIQIYTWLGRPLDEGYTNLAVKLPGSSVWTAPFSKELLYWTRPGSRNLYFTVINAVSNKIDLGSHLTIKALYKLCCNGMVCPTCPVALNLHAFDQTIVVNNSLQLNCEEYTMIYETDVVVQPKNYTIQISYSFVDDLALWQERRTIISSVQVTVSIIYSCDFESKLCDGWKISENSTTKISVKRGITRRENKGDSFLFPRPGTALLESPLLPWTAAYKRILLCVEFSYLLQSRTPSRLDVYSVTSAGENLLWILSGYQGFTWERARIPVQINEPFRIRFKSKSKSNVTEIAIKKFEVSTAACKVYPVYTQPGFQCPATKYQCANKHCTDKMYHCNGLKDGCIDGSDETGCKCSTGSFTCSDGKCIKYSKLCDQIKDCKGGEDEHRCDTICTGHLCFDGECVTGSCSSRVCEDKTHLFSKCGHCSGSSNIKNCTELGLKNDTQCQTLQGTCGFENGPCGLQSDLNSTFRWDFYSPTSKTNQFPSFDHSMSKGGSYYILRPSMNKTGSSELTMKWTKTLAYCMHFWYVIPMKSDSSLEVFIKTAKKRLSLWKLHGYSATSNWSFGQLQVPGDSVGKLIIVGNVKNDFVTLDDLSFIEGRCLPITTQDNPSCYFDDDKVCTMKVDNAWIITSNKLPSMHKQYSHHDSKDAYLALSQSVGYPVNISSSLIHPKSNGWRCLRFWLYSGKDYFSRNLDVLYVTGNVSRLVWSHTAVNNKWSFVQFHIPGEEDNLQVMIQGRKDSDAILAVDDITFSKYQCQDIPDNKLGQECYEYKILESPERRTDKTTVFQVYFSDDLLGTKTWYRITKSAGNQMAQFCVDYSAYACSSLYKGWVNGTMPSVEQGRVERELCFSINFNEKDCCKTPKVIKIRNCGEYFVYQFPKLSVSETKFCSVYNHKYLKLNISKEWKGWKKSSYPSQVQWKILNDVEFKQISESIRDTGHSSQDKGDITIQDIWFFLNGSVSFDVKLTGHLKSLTMCLWISVNNTSPLTLTLSIKYPPQWQISITLTRTNVSNSWKHFCFTWTSDFGVWQTYIDGVTTDYGIKVFDMKKLQDAVIGISFSSKDITLLKLNGLNVWDAVLVEHKILYMSYKCGREKGNKVDWAKFNISMVTNPKSSLIGYYSTSCNGRLGNTLSLITKTNTKIPAMATIVSPRYERSSESPGRCLKFRYRLWGPGARALRLYQIMDDSQFPRRPIWMDDDRNSSAWREGHVTLSAIMAYRIVFEGEATDTSGLLSIGALHTTEGYCPSLPTTANKACNEILTNSTGYVISPYYPGYYSNSAHCTWTIKAKKDHVIRLEIKEFELEMSPQCGDDFIEVFDGDSSLAVSRIGRFCGVKYPPIIQSTSNNLFIVFKSNAAIVRTGFMAHYRAIEDKQENSDCVQDCPADCVCERLQAGREQGIVISSTHLRSVPDRLPKESSAILFSGSQIFQLESENFYNLPRLLFIDLSFNKILKMEKKSFMDLPLLKALRLNSNFIKILEDDTWVGLPTLNSLDIGENLITSISGKVFSGLKNMEVLSLRRNKIKGLHVDAFQNNTNLTYLYLDENALERLPSGVFRHQHKLKVLKLNANKLQTFDKSTFRGLEMLEKLTLDNNTIKESTIPQDVFEDLTNLKHLKLDSFILCCYAKEAIPGLTCDSPGNSFSSCEDMLKNIVIRLGIWLQAIFASVGNLSVIIWWRILSKRAGSQSGKANVQSFLLTNLAFADFLMGIYLLIIAIKDTIWQDVYFKHDVDWRSGITCQIAGAISTLSSEVSVMILVAMTTDRLNTILFDFRAKRLNLKAVRILCFFVWIIGLIISFVPLFLPRYFNDNISGFSFYGRSTVCLPLQLSSDQPPGWEYSVAVFIVFNGAAIFFIFVAYVIIFIKVQRSAKQVRSTRATSSALGKRVVFVVLTDFCCWMPVIVLGVLSLAGVFKDPSGEVYAWIAVFVLPVNSSINPILYTFSTPQVKKKLRSIRTKKRPAVVSETTLRTQATCVRENPHKVPKFPSSRPTLKTLHEQNGIRNGGQETDCEDTSLDTKL